MPRVHWAEVVLPACAVRAESAPRAPALSRVGLRGEECGSGTWPGEASVPRPPLFTVPCKRPDIGLPIYQVGGQCLPVRVLLLSV